MTALEKREIHITLLIAKQSYFGVRSISMTLKDHMFPLNLRTKEITEVNSDRKAESENYEILVRYQVRLNITNTVRLLLLSYETK